MRCDSMSFIHVTSISHGVAGHVNVAPYVVRFKLMSDQSDTLISQLTKFGLGREEAEIYLLLLKDSSLSALAISREIKIARTKVYRLLDKLIVRGLVRQKLDERGLKFEAVSHTHLETLLIQKEQEVDVLRDTLPHLVRQLETVAAQGRTKSKVLYYTGVEGLEQVTWNCLKARDTLRIYEVAASMSVFIDEDLAEKIRQEFTDRQIKIRQLTNISHLKPFTRVPGHVKLWQVRYIDPAKLNLKFEVLIYNDVFAMYQFTGGEQFCVEVYNENLAAMQKQLFDFIWNQARKMKILNDRGEAILENL